MASAEDVPSWDANEERLVGYGAPVNALLTQTAFIIHRGTVDSMQRKTKRLEIRVTPEQKSLFRRAAEARAESLTQFVLKMSEAGAYEALDGTANTAPPFHLNLSLIPTASSGRKSNPLP